jgi:hypothetical protein
MRDTGNLDCSGLPKQYSCSGRFATEVTFRCTPQFVNDDGQAGHFAAPLLPACERV